ICLGIRIGTTYGANGVPAARNPLDGFYHFAGLFIRQGRKVHNQLVDFLSFLGLEHGLNIGHVFILAQVW
ncbi:MAG: hypothetical protein N2313_10990, partial [Meiothermus ruber]|nr:hypothetical protein [Meiothermus ruber]